MRPVAVLAALLLAALCSAQAAARCQVPISYRIGEVDPRFGLEETMLRAALRDAAAIWERAAGEALLVESDPASLTVEMVYDHRQAATETRRASQRALGPMRERLAELQRRHEAMATAYEADNEAFEARVARFGDDWRRLTERLEAWQEGRVEHSEALHDELRQRHAELLEKQEALQHRRTELLERARRINEESARIDRLAADINTLVEVYNRRAAETGGFELATYERSRERHAITIHRIEDPERLTLVLAHEIGHALGIGHVDDPGAIMHAQMTPENRDRTSLAPADRDALERVCDIR